MYKQIEKAKATQAERRKTKVGIGFPQWSHQLPMTMSIAWVRANDGHGKVVHLRRTRFKNTENG